MGILESSVVKMIVTGFCLGTGFWLCKKVTNLLDEQIVTKNKELMAAYVKQLNQGLSDPV